MDAASVTHPHHFAQQGPAIGRRVVARRALVRALTVASQELFVEQIVDGSSLESLTQSERLPCSYQDTATMTPAPVVPTAGTRLMCATLPRW